MSLLTLLCLFSVLINLEATSPGVCKIVTAKTTIFKYGKRLCGFQFKRLTTVPDIIQCARKCFFRRRCLSFNYNENSTICELSNARVDPPEAVLKTSLGYTYSDIDDWDEAIGMGPCSNQPCGICEACYPTEFKYICVKEELTSCKDIKICNYATSKGDYQIRPVMGTKPSLNIFCDKMASNYPKEMFARVHDGCIDEWLENVLHLDVTNLQVIFDEIIPSHACVPSAQNANDTCWKEFHIDLSGTGLEVEQINNSSVCKVQTYSSNIDIYINCTCSICEKCKPDNNLILKPSP